MAALLNKLKRSFRYSFWNFFDNIFTFLAINWLWFIIHLCLYHLVRFSVDNHSVQAMGEFSWADNFFWFPYFSNELSFFSFFFSDYFQPGLLNQTSVLLIKNLHDVMLFCIVCFFSPFSLSVWKLNTKISNKRANRLADFFTESYHQIFNSVKYLVIGGSLISFCYINIIFYQRVFANFAIITYAFIIIMLVLELLLLSCFMWSIPIMLNENKKILPAIKRSYLFFIKFLPSTSWLFLLFFSFMLGLQLKLFPNWLIIALLFFYPTFGGQFLNELYLTLAEHLGLTRVMEEKRGVSDFFSFKKRIAK